MQAERLSKNTSSVATEEKATAHYNNADYCVCCGAIVPEGTMVCLECVKKYK